jgi:hypothetical protein
MSKRFEARAALLDVGTIRGRLVSSQLSAQLPQNSGARGKGNRPLEVGRLQYLAGCPVSRCCDMISKRATKSKPNVRKVMARARNLEIYSNRGKGRAKAWEGRRDSSGPARAGTGLSLHSNPARPELVRSSQSRLAKALLPPRRSRRTFTQQMKKDKFSLSESLMITKAP